MDKYILTSAWILNHINDLVQDYDISGALAMEMSQSCTILAQLMEKQKFSVSIVAADGLAPYLVLSHLQVQW